MSKGKQHTKVIDANIIIDNEFVQAGDQELIFQDEPVTVLPGNASILDVLVASGISKSKGQARKTAHLEWVGDDNSFEKKVPSIETVLRPGFSEFRSGKLNHMVTIWNPTE